MLGLNVLKRKIATGNPVVLNFYPLTSPTLAEVIAAECDGVIIECEHSPISENDVENIIRAIESRGATPLVRVPSLARTDFIRLSCEAGAMGIICPHIHDAESARKLVSAVRFHPDGTRGAVPWSRSSGWNKLLREDYFRLTKEEVMIVPMIEDLEAVKNIDEILAVPGISWIMLGRGDLSAQMHAKYADPHFMEVCKTVIDACARAKIPYMVAGQGDEAAYWVRERNAAGVCVHLYGVLPPAWRKEVAALRSARKPV
jgi:2-keto-3-deoxy-L-rhamnonate aldolase RhmA